MCLLKLRYSCFISASYRLRLDHMRHAFFMIVAQHMGEDFDDLYIANENGYLKNKVHRGEGKVITATVENVHLMISKNISEVSWVWWPPIYIFNVGYQLKMKRTFLFIQLELLKVQGRDDRKDNVMKSFYKKIIESY